MDRVSICNRIGNEYKTENVENGEYSYVKAAGSMKKLTQALGYKPNHFKLDIRFEHNGVVILVETKQAFTRDDELQLSEYLLEEKAIHNSTKIICILANTSNNFIRVWKSEIDDAHLLLDETVLDSMEHYENLFGVSKQNDREAVLRNTYILNETLHKKDIDEKLRSQFVGTAYLYLQDVLKKRGVTAITAETLQQMNEYWSGLSAKQIRSGIEDTLSSLLDGSENKELKIKLLQRNVLENPKVLKLKQKDWVVILDEIVKNIYKYINEDSSEGQDILNLFFIAFNKYTGKADKNQAFTPDHITNFMCRVTGVDRSKRLFDGTCGSGSFLVQGMVLELADCNRAHVTEKEKEKLRKQIKSEQIYGVECEENVYGLATTNMLIHGDGNSNIKHGDLFECEEFFKKANPDIILMNPPYNAKPINIPEKYKKEWKKDAKEDPTKGMVFLKYISDIVEEWHKELLNAGEPVKPIKVAILLPVAAAIGTSNYISDIKKKLLEKNTLDAVFSLPNEIFYPGASASACCMVFTLGKPHVSADGTTPKTFFGYYKEDGHKKKKNLGRVEQFDKTTKQSIWKRIEKEWLDLYNNKTVKDGMSALQEVNGDDEWLCEAYMKTDYSKLCEVDFQQTLNNFLAYLVKEGKIWAFMENHIKSPRSNPLATVLKSSHAPKININAWKEFRVGDLFDIHPTKAIDGVSAYDCIEYGTPLVVNQSYNNGVAGKCDFLPTEKGGIITFSDTWEGNTFFYQPEDFIGFAHVQGMYPKKNMCMECLLFVVTTLEFEAQGRYSYGRKKRRDIILNANIMLPVNALGDPDWSYMENYIKALPFGGRLNA